MAVAAAAGQRAAAWRPGSAPTVKPRHLAPVQGPTALGGWACGSRAGRLLRELLGAPGCCWRLLSKCGLKRETRKANGAKQLAPACRRPMPPACMTRVSRAARFPGAAAVFLHDGWCPGMRCCCLDVTCHVTVLHVRHSVLGTTAHAPFSHRTRAGNLTMVALKCRQRLKLQHNRRRGTWHAHSSSGATPCRTTAAHGCAGASPAPAARSACRRRHSALCARQCARLHSGLQ